MTTKITTIHCTVQGYPNSLGIEVETIDGVINTIQVFTVDPPYFYRTLARFTTHHILVATEQGADKLVSKGTTCLFAELLTTAQQAVTASLNTRKFQVINGKFVIF